MNSYLGHPSQIFGVEEHRLTGGKGDGMRLLQIRNGQGLEFTVSIDRCADISRLSLFSYNIGYFAPSGYVAPSYYDNVENGFLKSFTAGFLTTCGLTAVGSVCEDNGEKLPLHGTISNTPCENHSYMVNENEIVVNALIRDAYLFGHQLELRRKYICSLTENKLTILDTVKNIGTRASPYMILYHFNIGYPMLSEYAKLKIPNKGITPRNNHASKYINNSLIIERPQRNFEEQCFYYDVIDEDNKAAVELYNEKVGIGLKMTYNKDQLDYFTQWKMMGEHEYVLGLEPGNCNPDGRDILRKNGQLKFIEPKQEITNQIDLIFTKEN